MAVVVGGESISLVGMTTEMKCVIEAHLCNKTKVMLYEPFIHSFYFKSHSKSCTYVTRQRVGVMKVGVVYAYQGI